MGQIWAIARQTIAESIRMRIALVFLLLMAFIVLGLPFSISDEASVTETVQSFISYSLAAIGVMLGMLTIFLSRSISDELVHRQIFLVATKPIARWRFIFGKWLGITLLTVSMLMMAGGIIYGMVYYIKATHPPIDERYDLAQLNNEVLVARHATKATLPDFSKLARQEFEQRKEEGLYANVPNFNRDEELKRLTAKYEWSWRVAGPFDQRIFEFDNILLDRSADQEIQIRYKAEISPPPPGEIFRAVWMAGNPQKDTPVVQRSVRHAIDRYHTMRFPASVVAADNTLTVCFFNENPFMDEPQFNSVIQFKPADEVEVLFVVGGFEGNLLRLLVMMACKLVFLAAVAVLAATLFSYPVACLTSFTIYVLAGSRVFIEEALDFSTSDQATLTASVSEFLLQGVWFVYRLLIQTAIPDFSYYDGVETLVNGRNVSLIWTLQAASELVLIKGAIVLGLAMIFFYRREVAEVSV